MNENILACGNCGEIYKEDAISAGKECLLDRCYGKIKKYNWLLLPTVQELSSKGLFVDGANIIEGLYCMDSYIVEKNTIEINIIFRDDYGNHFKPLPNGFEFDPQPDPSIHRTKFPIRVFKTLNRELSNVEQAKAILKIVADLFAWAEKH